MVKISVALLQVVLATVVLVNGESKESEGKGLVYIGSYPPKPQNYDINKYFISNNPTTWTTADEDCKNILGPNGALLSIDSIAEWEFLRVALESYGFGTTYWTSGLYDPTTSVWRWASNQQVIPPYPPWGPGFPHSPLTTHRILIYHTSRYDAFWRTIIDSQLHRYICKMRTPGIC
ncbi:Lithostathine [Pseudolycoriella hygida]|uniref:Lithostathine n=1 Tax=Pseudolycoriella hygida TaxID=35572 RepID=A0A9Q0MP97_9DIPT|nr:Lithostathine [Pseudolycoriella hygida]